jgi:recombinational DNA repair protein (RecF pathway)
VTREQIERDMLRLFSENFGEWVGLARGAARSKAKG